MRSFVFVVLAILSSTLGFAVDLVADAALRARAIVPYPQSASVSQTVVPIPQRVSVGLASSSFRALPPSVSDRLERVLSRVGSSYAIASDPSSAFLRFVEDLRLPDEGYRLTVGENGIEVRFASERGAFYALVTLGQILPDRRSVGAQVWAAKVDLRDSPRFEWRGLMLDSSRHFQTVAEIETVIEAMALHKLNRLHWHLSDDQGWRLEIPGWPRLTSVGAWRTEADGSRYGGYYTALDVRAVVAFAALRNVVVVPEIEFPGHSAAALAAYPELSVSGVERSVPSDWAVIDGVLAIGRARVRAFASDVRRTLVTLFPGPYIHWGGDEVYREPWRTDPESLAWFRQQGWTDARSFQSLVWARLAQETLDAGKIPIGWDEIAMHDLPARTIVQAWDDPARAVRALKRGHRVINSWKLYAYLDYPEWDWDGDRQDWMVVHPTYRSIDDERWVFWGKGESLTKAERERVLGIEACLWTERANFAKLARKLFPRLSVLAEVAWKGSDAPISIRSRMGVHRERLASEGFNVWNFDSKTDSTSSGP